MAGVSKLSEDNQEDDEARNPRVAFVSVHNLVSEECDQESSGGDDNNSSPSRHVRIYGVEQLCSNNNIYRTPSDASEDVQNSDDLNTIVLQAISIHFLNHKEDDLLRRSSGTEPSV